MRLWHEALIPYLPRQQLLGQHRECCALRGKGWGKSHSTVNYVFKHHPMYLVLYHIKVMDEMHRRGYHVNQLWYHPSYRGQHCDCYNVEAKGIEIWNNMRDSNAKVYVEHNNQYLQECLENLKTKGVEIF